MRVELKRGVLGSVTGLWRDILCCRLRAEALRINTSSKVEVDGKKPKLEAEEQMSVCVCGELLALYR
jgi:hypothetical protein